MTLVGIYVTYMPTKLIYMPTKIIYMPSKVTYLPKIDRIFNFSFVFADCSIVMRSWIIFLFRARTEKVVYILYILGLVRLYTTI